MLGIKGGRGAPDHRQLPSSDVEMISGVGAAVNGHAEERQQAPSDAAVYSLEDEDEDDDTDLVVGPEILSDDTQGVLKSLISLCSAPYHIHVCCEDAAHRLRWLRASWNEGHVTWLVQTSWRRQLGLAVLSRQ